MAALPNGFASNRDRLHRVAVHILARRRAAVSGKFGLRASPGGLATPAFGDGSEVLRVAGDRLVREIAGRATFTPMSTLAELAGAAGVDLAGEFSVGHATPPLGDPDERLALDEGATVVLGEWYLFGWRVLDTVIGELGPAAEPSVIQLWPEHFDAGVDVAAGSGRRTNLGASPGDGFQADPYLYVGPWGDERPGPAGYWNAPFGAVLPYAELEAAADPVAAACAFLREGIHRL